MLPLLGLGLGIGGKLLGGWLGKKLSGPGQEEKAAVDRMGADAQTTMGWGREMMPWARQNFGTAARAGQNIMNFANPLMGGNRAATMSLMSPQAKQVAESGRAATQQASALGGRSGATSSFLAEQPYARQSMVGGMLANMRAQAPGMMQNLMQTSGQQGLGQAGLANQFAGTSGMMNKSIADWGRQLASGQAQAGQGWGSFLGGVFDKIPGMLGGGSDKLAKATGAAAGQAVLGNYRMPY